MKLPAIRSNPLAMRILSVFDKKRSSGLEVDFSEFVHAMEVLGGYADKRSKLRSMIIYVLYLFSVI